MNSNPCVIPTQPDDQDSDNRWFHIHKRFLQDALEKDPEILFIGDDILEGLQFLPDIYNRFEEMHLLNFSIRADKIENVLWRISAAGGELENIKPKIIVLQAGTNNVSNSADEITEGIIECVNRIRQRHSESFIIVATLLPRGHQPNPLRVKNDKVNDMIKERLQGQPKVQIVDISKGLVQVDGSISHHDLPDFLNLSNATSKKIFAPILELLHQILNENEKEVLTPSE